MSGEDVVASVLTTALLTKLMDVASPGERFPVSGPDLRRVMRELLDEGVIVPGPAGGPTAEELEHDKVLDRAGEYVSPRRSDVARSYDMLMASARVLRVIADPAIDGADEWLVGSTFEGDYERALVVLLIEGLIKEGIVERRDGRLHAVPYEADEEVAGA